MKESLIAGRDAFFFRSIANELVEARKRHSPPSSAHESYAVILEELDEYWEQVKLKRHKRSREKMFVELVQIAAMAQRAAVEYLMSEGDCSDA